MGTGRAVCGSMGRVPGNGAGFGGFQTTVERRDTQVESKAGMKLDYVRVGDVDAPLYI